MKLNLVYGNKSYNILSIVMEYADKGDLYQKIVEYRKAMTYFEEIDISNKSPYVLLYDFCLFIF